MTSDRGNRTYHVDDERLRAYRALPAADKLRWVEELAAFLRLARPDVRHSAGEEKQTPPATG